MLLESLKASVLKSNVVLSISSGQITDNTGVFRSRSNRHSIYIHSADSLKLFAGNDCVYDNGGSNAIPVTLTWDDLGDMITRIDRVVAGLVVDVFACLIETWNEERPTEQP